MNRVFRKIILGITVFAPTAAMAVLYTVRSGDTLSEIAAKHFEGSVYGKNGGLAKLIKLNPEIRNPNRITVGQEIEVAKSLPLAETESKDKTDSTLSKPSRSLAEVNPADGAAYEKSNSAHSEKRSEKVANLSFTPEFFSTKLSSEDLSNGTKASLLSKSNLGFHLEYAHLWSENFFTNFYFGLSSVSFAAPNSSIGLKDDHATLYSFGLRGNYRFSNSGIVSLGIGSDESVYLLSVSPTQIALDTVFTPKLSLAVRTNLFELNPFALGMSAGTSIAVPMSTQNYKTKWNTGYVGSLFVAHKISETFSTETGVLGQYQNLNTSIVNQSETDYGIYLKLKWAFSERNDEAKK